MPALYKAAGSFQRLQARVNAEHRERQHMKDLLYTIAEDAMDLMDEYDSYEMADTECSIDYVADSIASDPDSVIAYLEDYEGTPAEAKALELIAKIKQISNL